MEENTITTVECRKLLELIRDITNGCILTRDEYNQIRGIITGAMKRCLEEFGRANEQKRNNEVFK